MNIKEFLNLRVPEKFDFSNDGAEDEYLKLDNIEDTYEKFFVYMALAKAYKRDKDDIMKLGAKFSQMCKEKYKFIPDPDSGSKLLQMIYTLLWEEENLKFCKKDNEIKGDTINSQNTTLNILYTYIETSEKKNERLNIGNNISIRYILSRYIEDRDGQISLFEQKNGLKEFLSVYHSLGNFIPCPINCNSPRGTGYTKDYWDLALLIIYMYYMGETDEIEYIVGKKNVCIYKLWLDSFKDWNMFVEKNYLQDYVTKDKENGYGIPIELWKGHFEAAKNGNIYPSESQIEEFYKNATLCILERAKKMLAAISQRLDVTE